MDRCKKCGGSMIGDDYESASHCEYVDRPEDAEADSGPWYCNFTEATETTDNSPTRVPQTTAPHNSCAGANTCATTPGDDVIE